MTPSSRFGPNGPGTGHPQISLAYLPPTLRQTRVALVGAGVLLLGLAVLAPFAAKPLPGFIGFIPAFDAVISVSDLITAGLLLVHFSITRSRALWALASGYLFSAVVVVGHALTAPVEFSPTGNLGGSPHTNFRIYLLWHLGLPVASFAYVWLRNKGRTKAGVTTPTEMVVTVGGVGVFALVSCIGWLALLPPVDPKAGWWLTVITMLICAAALSVLWVFQRSVLDQWLMVVVVAMIVELSITGLIGHSSPPPSGRGLRVVTLGFYAGRLVSLVTSTVVLIALLAETPRLYRLEERLNERTRIARELHDTLLQSFQGAVFQFQAARTLLRRNADNAMTVVDEAIQVAEKGIAEGRAAIHDLRPEPAVQRDLPELLNAAGRELADSQELNAHPPRFLVTVEGKEYLLAPLVQDEVYRIACEVMRNAFHHAAASLVEVEIRYGRDQLRLRIRDDGKGIAPKVLEAGGQSGHFGIPGMRERAQQIGARLDFWSEMRAGTEVQLTVPASMAYQKRRNGSRFRLFHRADRDEQRSSDKAVP